MKIITITGFFMTMLCGANLFAQGPPTNDDCADAYEIYLGNRSFSTVDATTDGDLHSSCQFNGQTYNDIWYTFTAGCEGTLVVSTCGQVNYDSDIVVYLGDDCNNLTLLGCNDDGTGCQETSYLEVPVFMGERLMIRIGGWNDGYVGSGTLTLDIVDDDGYSVYCPANDQCADAIAIVEGDTYFTTRGSTTDGPTHASCDASGDGGVTVNDIWYRYAATGTGTLTISTCGQANYDTDLVAYDGTDCSSLNFLDCNDDGCSTILSIVDISVVSGNEYLLRVGGWKDTSDSGTGTLTLAFEQDAVTWVGPAQGSWFTGSNWSTGAVPTSSDSVEIDSSVLIDQLGATASQVTIQNEGHLGVGVGASTAGSLNAPITVQSGGTLQLQNPSSAITSSDITFEDGSNLNWFGGTIDVSSGSITTTDNLSVGYFGEATLIADASTITADTLTIHAQGTLQGYSWCFVSQLNNYGKIEVGGSSANMYIYVAGDYVQSETGRLILDLGGESYNSSDKLIITGSSSLDGTLEVRSFNGYSPPDGASFITVDNTGDSNSGDFSTTVTSGFVAGTTFSGNSNTSGYTLQTSVNTIWFVDADHTTGTGTSWATAFPTVQAALAVVGSGEQIWVREGTYKPGTLRSSTYNIPTLVGLYGGFDGTETATDQRDIAAHPTILSGDIGTDSNNDDVYHVVTFTPNEWNYSLLNGFTITRGMATGTGSGENYGGGVYIKTGTLFIYDCFIHHNLADDKAGGVYVEDGFLYISYSTISDNFISDMQSGGPGFEDWGGTGGGAYIDGGGIGAYNVRFADNRANNAGGIALMDCNASFSDCEFYSNYCYYKGSGIYASSGTLSVESSLFDSNLATVLIVGTGSGGGLYAEFTDTTIKDSTFIRNEAGSGGGIYFYEVSSSTIAFIDRCDFRLNSSLDGSAFYADDDGANNVFIADSIFADNDGPTVHLSLGASGSRITNCTIVNNQNMGDLAAVTGLGSIENSIVWGNVGVYDRGLYNQVNGAITMQRSLIENGTEDVPYGLTNQDPMFRSERGPDGLFNTGDEDYRVLPSSIVIDFGNNTFCYSSLTEDLDGNARFQDDPYTSDWNPDAAPIVDLGCYEYVPQLAGVDGYRIWSEGGASNFSNNSNWLPSDAPTTNDIAYFDIGSNDYIEFNQNNTVKQLVIEGGWIEFWMNGYSLSLTDTNEPSLRIRETFRFINGEVVADQVDIASSGRVILDDTSTLTVNTRLILRDDAVFSGAATVVGNFYSSGTVMDLTGPEFPTINGNFSMADGALVGLEGSGTFIHSCTPIEFDAVNGYPKLTVNGTAELGGLLYLYRGQTAVYEGLSFTILETTQPLTTQFEAIMSAGFGLDGDLVPVVSYVNNLNNTGGSVVVTFQSVSGLLSFGDDDQTTLNALPADAEFADFNGDGYEDVAISLPDTISQILILVNGGMSGSRWNGFTSSKQFSAGDTSAGLAIGDLDGDGDLDIVVANTADDTVTFLQNVWDTNATLGFIKPIADIPTDFYGDAASLDTLPTDVAIGNFHTTTSVDIAVANSGDGMMAIINGPILAASFMPGGSNHSTGGGAASIDPIDVNDDKDLDKVVVTGAGGETSVFKSADSAFGLVLEYDEPDVYDVGDGISEQVIADVDGNGWNDLIVADNVGNSIDILLQTSEDVYAASVQLPLPGTNPQSIATIDLDGDSDLDLVVVMTNLNGDIVARIFRNDTEYGNGEAIFTDFGYEQDGGTNETPLLARSADIDGDGVDDLWLATQTVTPFRSTAVGTTQTSLNELDLGVPCPGDIDDDGIVGVEDLLAVIAGWGSSDPDADLNNDGTVNVEDLLVLIGAWGACPS